jgi:flagella basal body P-ring formation protein FlgA
VVLVSAAWAQGLPAAAQATTAADDEVRAAIVQAVSKRVGEDAAVRVEDLLVKLGAVTEGEMVATPEPGMRLGRPGRFSLSRKDLKGGPTRFAGYATATVFVETDCVRMARAVPAGAVLSHEDIVSERGDVGEIALQRLPDVSDVLGSKMRRQLEEGALLLSSMIAVRRLVQSGDAVTIKSKADGVEAEARGVATQSGGAGEIIRVVNSSSRRALNARVVGSGEVEVIR